MASIQVFLQRLGFTHSEAAVYDFLLKEGSATAQEVYKNLGLNRVTVYEIMKRFLKRGFVTKSKRVGRDLFVLESPDRLKDLIAEKKLNIKKLETEVKELEEVFEDDFKQIKQVQDAREKEMEVKFYSNSEEFEKDGPYKFSYIYEVFNKDSVARWHPYDKKRKKEFIKALESHYPFPIIAMYTGLSSVPKYFLERQNSTLIFLNQEKYPIFAEVSVSSEGITFFDTTENNFRAIRIRNKRIAQTLITLINMAAETAKRDALHIKESNAKPPRKIV